MSIKSQQHKTTTITGLASPSGVGGVHIVRLSGSDALGIATKLLYIGDKSGKKTTKIKKDYLKPRVATFVSLKTQKISDSVLVIYFKAPNSFTGEDIVEIHCHGNILISTLIINELIFLGAKMAEPGEFSKRAFLNGKIDLSSAEGLLDLINAKLVSSINVANSSMNGSVFEAIEQISTKITAKLAHLSALIDYPEEDILGIDLGEVKRELEEARQKLKKLENSYRDGKIRQEGVKVAIVGAPNVGKSMLLNALLGFDRAIVTSEAGTTRDTLDASFTYKDILFTIVDTAGIRETKNEAEKLGVERSKKAIETADLLLCVSCPNNEFSVALPKNTKSIDIFNKCDLLDGLKNKEKLAIDSKKLKISAKNGQNIDLLKEEIFKLGVGSISTDGTVLTNARHYSAVLQAKQALSQAIDNIDSFSIECILSDLNAVLRALGAITGKLASEEVINEIFSKFCVGK